MVATKTRDPLLGRVEISKVLNVSLATLDRLVREGLPHLQVRGAKRFDLPQVLEHLRSRAVRTRRSRPSLKRRLDEGAA
jgi:phage terminase Nu1 subunit (DNA packaging protein)